MHVHLKTARDGALQIAAVLVSIAMLLGSPVPGTAAAPGQPTNTAACVSILKFGAKSGQYATTALRQAVLAAKSTSEQCVFVPVGTFKVTRFTVDDGVKLIGTGDSSVLYAPDPADRQLNLVGSGSGVYRLKLLTQGTQRTNDNEGILIDGAATNFVIDNVTIDGGNGPGIITFGGSYGRITNNRVFNTLSDAIHLSGGANYIYVAGNTVRNSGDDMIAVVTYDYQPINSYEILIENNDLANQKWGRGITVVGGERVTIRNNRITASSDAGIYIAAESSWSTRGVDNVKVQNNRLDRCPMAHPEHGQSSILVYADNSFWIKNVLLDANTITNSPTEPLRVESHNVQNVVCANNTYNGTSVTTNNCSGNASVIEGTSVTSAILGGTTVPLPISD